MFACGTVKPERQSEPPFTLPSGVRIILCCRAPHLPALICVHLWAAASPREIRGMQAGAIEPMDPGIASSAFRTALRGSDDGRRQAADRSRAAPPAGTRGRRCWLADLVRRLSDRFDFTLLCLDGIGELGETLAAEGHEVIELGRRPGIDLAVARRLGGVLRDRKVDLVHAHQYTPFFYTPRWAESLLAAVGVGAAPAAPVHRARPALPRPAQTKPSAGQPLAAPPARPRHGGGRVRQSGHSSTTRASPPGGSRWSTTGSTLRAFPPRDDASIAAARQRLGLDRDTTVLMQVARFHPVKDHETSVRAVAELTQRDPDFTMVYVGDGETREAMERLAEELGVAGGAASSACGGTCTRSCPRRTCSCSRR